MNDLIFKNEDELIWKSEDVSELINNEYYDHIYPEIDNSIALNNLLNGDAQGTKENFYLDPTPFLNKKGIDYLSARADEIKVGIENMDYTGENREDENELLSYIFNLLMPRYARRVEVEDLNKNFWVIAQTIDAILSSIWGHDGIIDIIQELIKRQNILYSRIRNIEYEIGALDPAICHLSPNFSSFFDDGTYFDLNGDGLMGQDDVALLLSFTAYSSSQGLSNLRETVNGFVDNCLKISNENFSQFPPNMDSEFTGEWGIRDYNNLTGEFNTTIRLRENYDQLRISDGNFLYFAKLDSEEFCCGIFFPGYSLVDSTLSFEAAKEKIKEILSDKLIQLSNFFELNAKAASIIKIRISNFPIEGYENQTEKIQYNYEKFRDFGFLYDKTIEKKEDIIDAPQPFGEKLTHFFYCDTKDKETKAGEYEWESNVFTSGYCISDGEIINDWVLIPHQYAYQPSRTNIVKRLVAVFDNFDTFFRYFKDEETRSNRLSVLRQLLLGGTRNPTYILFVNESIKQRETIGLCFTREEDVNDFITIFLNSIDSMSSKDFYKSYFDTHLRVYYQNCFTKGTNINVHYWGGIEKNNYFEIMRIMSRRVHFSISDTLDTVNIQNYCYPRYGIEGEGYYLRYDIRRIVLYYWCEDFKITKCKNYFGPFYRRHIARFRGRYFYKLDPFSVEDELCHEEDKIYINRVHTPRHNIDGKWTQCSEFYTVQSKNNNELSGNLGSPHCADIDDNFISQTNWENPDQFSVCKIDFYGHEPGITYTTEIEKTWFLNEDEKDNLESVFIEDSSLAW